MRAQKHSGDGGYNGKCEKCQAKVDSVQPDHPPWTHLENTLEFIQGWFNGQWSKTKLRRQKDHNFVIFLPSQWRVI